MKTSRSTLIGAAVAMALFKPTAPVHADDAAAEQLDEVVVTGIRGSLRQSIAVKRDNVAIVDAISAEDVGKFPDKNLAEALQRVPGVTISRDFGEGERVNLRGTNSNLTRTLLNGHGLATADWFILDQLNSTRSFNYLMLPSDVIGQVEVFKSPQADFEEGGIGGTINVKTRRPLDMKPMEVAITAQAAYTELSESLDPQIGGLFSWKNEGETLGILVGAKYEKRDIRRDGVEVLGYNPIDTDPGEGVTEVLIPSLIGSALFQQERERKSANFEIQFAPTDKLDISLAGLYSKFGADNLNENFMAWGSRAIANGGTLTNATIIDGTAVAGTIASDEGGTADFGVVYDAITRLASADTTSINFEVGYEFTEGFKMNARIGTTEASGNTDAQPFVEFGAPAAWTFDLRGRAPQVSYANVDATDPDEMQFIFSSLHQILNDDSEDYAYLDFTKSFGDRGFKSLKFGAKVTDHDRDLVFNATTYGGFHAPINTLPASAFAGGPTPSDFLDRIKSAGTLDAYWQIDRGAVTDILFENFENGPGRVLYPQQSFSVTEKGTAGYLMANFGGESWDGNIGVRYVKTDQTSRGYLSNVLGGIPNPFGAYEPISIDRDYTDTLPSANFKWDLPNNLILHVSAAKVMARPDYTDVAPRVSLNPGALSGTGGNPDLDPYRATQADVSLEWYPDADSKFAAALYYKDIKSFITDRPGVENFLVQGETAPSLACTEGPEEDTFMCPFTINRRTNGGGGKIKGAELSIVKQIAGGFGIDANYTYSDAEADNGDPIPGNSKNTYNVSAFFENSRLSSRLAYTFRSEYFVTFDRSTQLNQKDLSSLDASFSVNVTDNIVGTFEAQNILNEKSEFYAGEEFRPRGIYDNGRTYYLGARFKF